MTMHETAIHDVSSSYYVGANNCTNITISTNNNDDTSSNDDVVIQADHCANITIDTEQKIAYLNNNHGIVIGSVVAVAFFLALFIFCVLSYFKSKNRNPSEATLDTSQAPVADAMNLKFRNPSGRFSRLKTYFQDCCSK